ncbi:hypothetical protein KV205_09935 [Streptomyces sp. SKN60]|uniref:hypothetical protein n=1 Tax=Streptomyces sp. SKN60 TaxID=2855506 RepID=UPI0022454E99|nr:hypothetical protein [Streptomyces sp. SKN60]MCX2180846.1 hypothetical protein [Streptomyces sp. SKN60]
MTATTSTLTSMTSPISRRLGLALRAVHAFGAAAVGVVLLGSYDDHAAAGVRAPRPEYANGPD